MKLILILTLFYQNFLVYGQTGGPCVQSVRVEPQQFLSYGSQIFITFENPNFNILNVTEIYFYEPTRNRLVCTQLSGLPKFDENYNLIWCFTGRDQRESPYAFGTEVDFRFVGKCQFASGSQPPVDVALNLTKPVKIVDPVVEYISPSSIFLDHSTLIVFHFIQIAEISYNGLGIKSSDLDCKGTELIISGFNRGARAYCTLTVNNIPPTRKVHILLDQNGIRLSETWVDFVERPVLSRIIEPVFGGSCHPIHLTGQHLNNLEAFELSFLQSKRIVTNCKLVNDTHYRCSFRNDLPSTSQLAYERVFLKTHGSLFNAQQPFNLVKKPAPNVEKVTYDFETKTITIHLNNFEVVYETNTTIALFDLKEDVIILCSGPFKFNEQNSTISCIAERQMSDSPGNKAQINISCKHTIIDVTRIEHTSDSSWIIVLIGLMIPIIIITSLCINRNPMKAYAAPSKGKQPSAIKEVPEKIEDTQYASTLPKSESGLKSILKKPSEKSPKSGKLKRVSLSLVSAEKQLSEGVPEQKSSQMVGTTVPLKTTIREDTKDASRTLESKSLLNKRQLSERLSRNKSSQMVGKAAPLKTANREDTQTTLSTFESISLTNDDEIVPPKKLSWVKSSSDGSSLAPKHRSKKSPKLKSKTKSKNK